MSKRNFRKIKEFGSQLVKSAQNYAKKYPRETNQQKIVEKQQPLNNSHQQKLSDQKKWSSYSKNLNNIINNAKVSTKKYIDQSLSKTQQLKKRGSQITKEKYNQIQNKIEQKVQQSKQGLKQKTKDKFRNWKQHLQKKSNDAKHLIKDENPVKQASSYFTNLKDRYSSRSSQNKPQKVYQIDFKQKVTVKGISEKVLKDAQKLNQQKQHENISKANQSQFLEKLPKRKNEQAKQQSNKQNKPKLMDIIHSITTKIRSPTSQFFKQSFEKGSQFFKGSETKISEKVKGLFLKYRMMFFFWFLCGMFVYGIASQIPRQLRLYIRDQTLLKRSKKAKGKDYDDEQDQDDESKVDNTKQQQVKALSKKVSQLEKKLKQYGWEQKKQKLQSQKQK